MSRWIWTNKSSTEFGLG